METPDVSSLNVWQKLHKAWESFSYVQKTGQVKGRKTAYTFVAYDRLVAEIRRVLLDARLVYYPELVRCDVLPSGHLEVPDTCVVKIRLHVIDIDHPDDKVIADGFGTGANEWNKGAGIATTYATKNALLKLFALESGDEDPEFREAANGDKPQKPQERVVEADPAETEEQARRALYDEISELMQMHQIPKDVVSQLFGGKAASELSLPELQKVPADIRARFIKVDVENDPQPLHESYAQIHQFLKELDQTESDLSDVLREHFEAETLEDLDAKSCHRLALILRTKVNVTNGKKGAKK